MQGHYNVWDFIVDSRRNTGLDMVLKVSAEVTGPADMNNNIFPLSGQNVPNPFSDAIRIPFYLSEPGSIKVSI